MFKRKNAQPVQKPVDKFETIDLLFEVLQKVQLGQIGAACKLMGMDEKDFVDAKFTDVLDALMVRVADLTKKIGLENK